jgi:hypothetical protein
MENRDQASLVPPWSSARRWHSTAQNLQYFFPVLSFFHSYNEK